MEANNQARRQLAKRYSEALNGLPIQMPNYHEHSVYHIFPILVDDRDNLQRYLQENGIGTLIHYPLAPHHQQCYRDYDLG